MRFILIHHFVVAGFVQNSLCVEVVQRISAYQLQLDWAVSVCAEVDCIAALAMCARDGGYSRPTLTEDDTIFIRKGHSYPC